ncbi:alpha/beta hydrolase [Bradyrhizobium sp. HKCCYLR20261]|uniref:alpha/beta hydrolase n=1 Tax=Bradyrhizobium sp. HKCCYLR20261 TaxID=3420760 RepID=UPI003EB7282D
MSTNHVRWTVTNTARQGILGLSSFAWILLVPALAGAQELYDLPYGPEPQQKLDLCLPSTPTLAPAVVMIHGGGWSGGTKESFRPWCKLFASKGIVAVTVSYQLADGSRIGAWPAQLNDVEEAGAWLSEHASQYNVDPGKICAFGNSAGGHIALMLGSGEPTTRRKFKPACIVDNWGVVDLTYPPPVSGALRKLIPDVSDADRSLGAKALSPLNGVGADFPPVFVAQGTLDQLVPPAQSEALVQNLKANKVPYELVEFQGGHEMVGLEADEKSAILELEIAFVRRSGRRLMTVRQ